MNDSYEIIVEGHLGPGLEEWFEGMDFEQKFNGDGHFPLTFITGVISDQAALHGILNKIRDLGLTLVSLRRIQPKPNRFEKGKITAGDRS